MERVDVLIIGAGVIGSSVAMHLAQLGMTKIRVIDFDLEGSLSSSELNAGGVRATWVQPVNIEMSKMSIEYFAQKSKHVGYRACGYLWLYTKERMNAALQARDRQIQSGWPVEVWDRSELQRKVPFLDKTEDIGCSLFAPRDGLINPNLLKNHFRSEARALGVVFDDRTSLQKVIYPEQSGHLIQAVTHRFESSLSDETKLDFAADRFKWDGQGGQVEYHADCIINCAGPWATRVAKILGYESPAYPMRRQVCLFDCRGLDLTPYGMIVDTSGVYFHPEADHVLAGFANTSEPRGVSYSYDGESFLTESIWPALFERSTYFEKLKHLSGWAGLYDVSPDECAIIGQVDYGGIQAKQMVFEAHSFSGHGVMHSYSAGLALAEKIVKGRYESLEDVNVLAGSRFEKGKWVHESLVI